MPADEPRRPGADRRSVLRLGLSGSSLATVMALSACGIRLEDDAPSIPLLRRTPLPAEDALIALTRGCLELEAYAGRVDGALPTALAPLHRRQHDVLRDALLARDVPQAALTSSPASTASATGRAGATPAPSPAVSATPAPGPAVSMGPATARGLASAEGASVPAAAALAPAPAELVPSVVALLAQRHAAVALLGGPLPRSAPPSGSPSASPTGSPSASPTGSPRGWSDPTALGALVTAGRRAAYLFEVVAAQTHGVARTRALGTVTDLTAVLGEQVRAMASGAPAPSLGEPLPFAVTTPRSAKRLATRAAQDLRRAYGTALADLVATDAAAALATGARWLGTVEVVARRWGAPLAAFPGLTRAGPSSLRRGSSGWRGCLPRQARPVRSGPAGWTGWSATCSPTGTCASTGPR